jgi:hypothetical protein
MFVILFYAVQLPRLNRIRFVWDDPSPNKTDGVALKIFPRHRTMPLIVFTGKRRKRILPPPRPDPRAVFSGALAQLKQVVRLKRKQSERLYPQVPSQQRQRFLPVLNAIRSEDVPPRQLLRPMEIPARPALPRQENVPPMNLPHLNSAHRYEIEFSYTFVISNDVPRTRTYTIADFRGTDAELRAEMERIIDDYIGRENPQILENIVLRARDLTTMQYVEYNAVNMRMREYQPLDIVNLFGEKIQLITSDDNCVKAVLRKKYPKIAEQRKDPIGSLGNADGVSTADIKQFCEKYKIPMVAYGVHGNVIDQHKPDSKNYPSLIYLAYGNHIYPVKGVLHDLHFKKTNPDKLIHQQLSSEDLQVKFDELINVHRRHPSDIEINPVGQTIRSFIDGNTIYFYNSQYDDCRDILKSYGLENLLTPNISLSSVWSHIAEHYQGDDYRSFFPIDHVKSPLHYQSPITGGETITIDHNKFYSNALASLDYLLTTDFRQENVDNNETLVPCALYVATPEYSSVLLQKQDIYAGEHLIYAKKKGFKFTIDERILCRRKQNVFSRIIPDLYERLPETLFKRFINRIIGTFQSSAKASNRYINAVISTKDELHEDYGHIQYGDRYLQYDSEAYVANIYNHQPIAIQIKDKASRMLYEKMESLKLHMSHIRQINTDSITIDVSAVKNLKVEGKGLRGWKFGKYEVRQPTRNVYNSKVTMKQNWRNKNTLITGNAGNGKSYDIQNRLIPELEAKAESYIILSSKHSAIVQHRNNNRNAQVIQKYEFSRTTPAEQHIIIEECGIMMRTHWDLLYKWYLLGKTITAYGDFRQLLPVKEHAPFNAQSWLDLMFSTQLNKNENHRNDFTPEYYDDLINGKLDIKAELLKYSTKTPEEAEVIIAHRNEIVDAYNLRMAEYHGIEYELDDNGHIENIQAGVKLICKDNDLRDKQIYNNMMFDSDEIDEDDLKHFKLAYARTLYNLQGDAVESFYVAPEDMVYFAQTRFAYTLISRLKTK